MGATGQDEASCAKRRGRGRGQHLDGAGHGDHANYGSAPRPRAQDEACAREQSASAWQGQWAGSKVLQVRQTSVECVCCMRMAQRVLVEPTLEVLDAARLRGGAGGSTASSSSSSESSSSSTSSSSDVSSNDGSARGSSTNGRDSSAHSEGDPRRRRVGSVESLPSQEPNAPVGVGGSWRRRRRRQRGPETMADLRARYERYAQQINRLVARKGKKWKRVECVRRK